MTKLLRLLAIGFLATAHLGAAEDVPLSFTRLDLADGRKLRNVVVKSYDAASDKLLVLANGKAMTFPVALVPAPFREQLRAAPASGATVNTIAAPKRPLATASQQYISATNVPAPPSAVPAPRTTVRPARREPHVVIIPDPANPARTSGATLDPRVLEAHRAAAEQRAHTYYRYEFPVGPASVSITALNFEFTTPKPVPGWAGRFETQGKAFLEFWDSRGRSMQRTTSTFEITTEQRPAGDIEVVDLRRRS